MILSERRTKTQKNYCNKMILCKSSFLMNVTGFIEMIQFTYKSYLSRLTHIPFIKLRGDLQRPGYLHRIHAIAAAGET